MWVLILVIHHKNTKKWITLNQRRKFVSATGGRGGGQERHKAQHMEIWTEMTKINQNIMIANIYTYIYIGVSSPMSSHQKLKKFSNAQII